MSKKRKRELDDFGLELVRVWDELADDNESTRLKAAGQLVSKSFEKQNESGERLSRTLQRLFRGLCSSRKSARLGFSVALTEFLSQLSKSKSSDSLQQLSGDNVISILERETNLDKSSSRQDERDHRLGQVFGAEALVTSQFVFGSQSTSEDWKRLIALICTVAKAKPWLRQQCGWILYQSVEHLSSIGNPSRSAEMIIEQLVSDALVRTPEGLSIWLAILRHYPNAVLPEHVWMDGDPLSSGNAQILAEVMKDAKPANVDNPEEPVSQGTARWSQTLHFAWDVILEYLAKSRSTKSGKYIDFGTFWSVVVAGGLFSPSSSIERKHWGLLLLAKAFAETQTSDLQTLFSGSVVQCLVESLKRDDKYLTRTAKRAIRALEARLHRDGDPCLRCLPQLIQAAGWVDIDKVTKTRLVESILKFPSTASTALIDALGMLRIAAYAAAEPVMRETRQIQYIELYEKAFNLQLLNLDHSDSWTERILELFRGMAQPWLTSICYKTPSSDADETDKVRQKMQATLTSSLEKALRQGQIGRQCLKEAAVGLRQLDQTRETENRTRRAEFDPEIERIVADAWMSFDDLDQTTEKRKAAKVNKTTRGRSVFDEGMITLYSMALLQTYYGDTQAVQVLEDLVLYQDSKTKSQKRSDRPQSSDGVGKESEALLDILLSVISQESKFMRRLSLQIFEAFAGEIDTLEPLLRVLETKESIEGQAEMFEAADEVVRDDANGFDDSDVELLSGSGDSATDETTPNSDSDSDDASTETNTTGTDGSQTDEKDQELVEFEGKLAAALGTRKLTDDDLKDFDEASASDDSDMSSEAMLALDSKLTDVFRARQEQSSSKSKRQEQKTARENIVNLKNKVLDLIEVFVRSQHRNSNVPWILDSMLRLARTTRAKQLADRAGSIIRDVANRCKGSSNLPTITALDSTWTRELRISAEEPNILESMVSFLSMIHDEASTVSGLGHTPVQKWSAMCSTASLLMTKIIIHSCSAQSLEINQALGMIATVYHESRVKQLTSPSSKIQPPFFTDWNNWCAQYVQETHRRSKEAVVQGNGHHHASAKRQEKAASTDVPAQLRQQGKGVDKTLEDRVARKSKSKEGKKRKNHKGEQKRD